MADIKAARDPPTRSLRLFGKANNGNSRGRVEQETEFLRQCVPESTVVGLNDSSVSLEAEYTREETGLSTGRIAPFRT